MAGHVGGAGRKRASASSTWTRARFRNSASDSAVTTPSTAFGILGGKRARRGLQLAALVQNLDAALRLFEPRVTEPRELHAALVQRQRLFEREVAFLELLDDRFELGDRGFEVFDRRVSHLDTRVNTKDTKDTKEKRTGLTLVSLVSLVCDRRSNVLRSP